MNIWQKHYLMLDMLLEPPAMDNCPKTKAAAMQKEMLWSGYRRDTAH